ncbi:MAG: hypothetical protein KKF41_04445 [Actinobacteria bacterium]|nr:hypothetical protein [Actinomycetota bacterium]MBU1943460.1 hypothetical protein [Actinomycetota bacterium]MBU2686817.1 hypothetical protein [Actinomycetota bacterium]
MIGSSRVRRQQGFSMAEVVAATIIFIASVTGISSMMLSGGAHVNRGARESLAAQLATEQVEAVKSLRFYRAYDPDEGPIDMDDLYFNAARPNGIEGDEGAHPQLDTPAVIEDYGDIPGQPEYRRTTAVEYQFVSEAGGIQHLAPAVMHDGWVPSDTGGTGQDRPVGGASADADEDLHAILIEVCVFYRYEDREVSCKEQALAGDVLVTGGIGTPILKVNKIEPTSGLKTDNHLEVEISVEAPGLAPGALLDVRLWRPGSADVVASSPVPNPGGTVISCWFDLTPTEVAPGTYSLAVYWKDEGWIDKSYRNCFTVVTPAPVIDSIDNADWGYRQQPARRVTIHGDNLEYASLVRLVGPCGGGPQLVVPGSVFASSPHEVAADFNLTAVPSDPEYQNTLWDVELTTPGGTGVSTDDGARMLINPKPALTAVQDCEGGGQDPDVYRKKAYQGITLYGSYFQGSGTLPTVTLTRAGCPDIVAPHCEATGVTEVGDAETHIDLDLDLGLTQAGGPFTWGNAGSENGDWSVTVKNQDGQQTSETVAVNVANAPMAVTTPGTDEAGYNYFNCAYHPLTLGTITGDHFQPGGTTVTFWNGSDCYDPFEGVPTIEGTPVVAGAYGAGQTITGNTLNMIKVPAGWGWIKITDEENGQDCGYSFEVRYLRPLLATQTSDPATRGVSIEERCNQADPHTPLCTWSGSYTMPWSDDCWSHLFGHTHHYYHRFRLRGMGMWGNVSIQTSGRDYWNNLCWPDDYYAGQTWSGVATCIDRPTKTIYVDQTTEFHDCAPYPKDGGFFWCVTDNAVRVRNNAGDTGWTQTADDFWRLYPH